MFAYCGNNPANCIDTQGEMWKYVVEEVKTEKKETDENNTYITTITYRAIDKPIWGCTPFVTEIVFEVSFEYSITDSGIITFDNEQLAAKHLEITCVRDALAKEIHNVAKAKDETLLQGRTQNGLSAELYAHFAVHYYEFPLFYAKSHQTDMGSIGKQSGSYDWNAVYFEIVFGWLDSFS